VRGLSQDDRVLRGGSFNNNQNNARCAYRNRNEPDNFNNNLGFRLVLSTPLHYAGNAAGL
jgi:formylglycine-generating enzyme required for sulfatase activity